MKKRRKSVQTSADNDLRHILSRVMDTAVYPLRPDDILRRGNIPRWQKLDMLAVLEDMVQAGTLTLLQGKGWLPSCRLKTIRGTLVMQRSGATFVIPIMKHQNRQSSRGLDKADLSDQHIYIAPGNSGDAWNGDEVEVVVLPGRRGPLPEGIVRAVLRRVQREITVRVLRQVSSDPPQVFARPVDPRLDFGTLVDVSTLEQIPTKQQLLRVVVGEALPSASPLWACTALASLGREDDVTVQEQLTKLNHGIPTAFPDDVLAETAGMDCLEAETREEVRDLRALPLVTIDGEDARDFDDAVYVEQKGNSWRLLVAIADVSFYVRPRSALDREAKDRGNSYYFPASVEPMLPEALSNGLCSLRPGEDRRVLAVDMDVDASGHTFRSSLYAGLMRSHARLTYTEVQRFFDRKDEDNTPSIPDPVRSMLNAARELAAVQIRRRQEQGGLDFDLTEAEYVLEQGRVTGMRRRSRQFSHRLIEAFMVAANEAAARFLGERKAPFLYRVHPQPDPEKLATLLRSLRAIRQDDSLTLPRQDVVKKGDASWLSGLLREAEDSPLSGVVSRLALRSMMQARYSPIPEGHFGLGSAGYCHFTSPIRRYADLVNHRALRYALGLETGGAIPAGQKLLAVAQICNDREKTAQDAEREIARRLGCLLLRDRVGEVFSGIISGVIPFGFFVELDAMPLDGLVKVQSLGREFFEYNADRHELRGKRTVWRLGQEVRVRLIAVNVGRLEIDLIPLRDSRTPLGLRPEPCRGFAPNPAGGNDFPQTPSLMGGGMREG